MFQLDDQTRPPQAEAEGPPVVEDEHAPAGPIQTFEVLVEVERAHMYYGLHRPPWKRVALTVLGVVLTVVGLLLWLTPVLPGGFLAYIGIPLLFAASPRIESRIRRWIKHRFLRLRVRWRRWRQ
ncbi:hypothetical protein [Engelhardtia mirabilis]|uniref:Transmembrane protein (PGPGW) n=1 Tax=Engelhardtia mirabilis TaxID=2528011 RepID=A0A518BIT3_9BACT|nr:hypothetical protein Pla133_19390 [Planctomycetes bacterium Pla133]QDV01189.1 hypothetical protein Pla86_19380 [Planctomycetes bacterium Pla86]